MEHCYTIFDVDGLDRDTAFNHETDSIEISSIRRHPEGNIFIHMIQRQIKTFRQQEPSGFFNLVCCHGAVGSPS